MTAGVSPNVDAKKYGRLLSRALPSAIKTDRQYERMLAEVWRLMRKGTDNLSAEEMALLELISVLIENYEDQKYPIPDAAPHDVLRTLMQERGLRQKDMVHIFRFSSTASKVLSGKRQISKAQAKALAEFFHVSPEVFI
jgi:HTH-type transcriptional regulator/antitoxin HigA